MEMKFTSTMESVYDGRTYCWTNGQFNRHLATHNTNFEEYYATYITGVVPVCPYCFKPRKFYQKKLSYIETCGASQCISRQRLEMNANMPEEQRAAISAKKREAWLNKTPEELAEKRAKSAKTCIERYGGVAPACSPEIQAKIRATNQLHRGVDYAPQCPKTTARRTETLMATRGVAHQMHDKTVVSKVSLAHKRRHYDGKFDTIDRQLVYDLYKSGGILGLIEYFKISESQAYKLLREFDVPLEHQKRSIFEQRVYNYVSSLYTGVIKKARKGVIHRGELDLYMPNLGLAIECNGSYWHTLAKRSCRFYHMDKTTSAASVNVKLLHIWDFDWYTDEQHCMNLIHSHITMGGALSSFQNIEWEIQPGDDNSVFLYQPRFIGPVNLTQLPEEFTKYQNYSTVVVTVSNDLGLDYYLRRRACAVVHMPPGICYTQRDRDGNIETHAYDSGMTSYTFKRRLNTIST